MPPSSSTKRRRSDGSPDDNEIRRFNRYTMLVVLIALAFSLAIMYVKTGIALSDGWSKIAACLSNKSSCAPPS